MMVVAAARLTGACWVLGCGGGGGAGVVLIYATQNTFSGAHSP
jgi:hypothetical protein